MRFYQNDNSSEPKLPEFLEYKRVMVSVSDDVNITFELSVCKLCLS